MIVQTAFVFIAGILFITACSQQEASQTPSWTGPSVEKSQQFVDACVEAGSNMRSVCVCMEDLAASEFDEDGYNSLYLRLTGKRFESSKARTKSSMSVMQVMKAAKKMSEECRGAAGSQ